ncbi:MAG: hypothetical protein IKO20_04055 [Bacteroidaceae bacterium]|nr:hypothetical protein [Bacteroidaceae bacterium]
MKPTLIIAIDPDVDKSGIAILNVPTREIKLLSLNFPETIEFLFEQIAAHEPHEPLAVCIEAGWLNDSNFHLKPYYSLKYAARLGCNVGRNEQISRCLIEYSKWLADKQNTPLITVHAIRPLEKHWYGKDKKITHEELAYFVHGLPKSNQENRDAALIAWTHVNLPTPQMPFSEFLAALPDDRREKYLQRRLNNKSSKPLPPTQNRLTVQQFKQLLNKKNNGNTHS